MLACGGRCWGWVMMWWALLGRSVLGLGGFDETHINIGWAAETHKMVVTPITGVSLFQPPGFKEHGAAAATSVEHVLDKEDPGRQGQGGLAAPGMHWRGWLRLLEKKKLAEI